MQYLAYVDVDIFRFASHIKVRWYLRYLRTVHIHRPRMSRFISLILILTFYKFETFYMKNLYDWPRKNICFNEINYEMQNKIVDRPRVS